MAEPLKGVKILDLSHVYYGPFTTMVLGSMGAEVIKIEPNWGEMSRLYPPMVKNQSSPFMYLNRCKKGITLNLKSTEGKEVFFKLLEDADIVVENFKRGTMEKLGIGYEDLRARKPDIIYAALSGFGVDGPYRDRPSFAPVAEAMSGWMRLTGDLIDHNGPPIRPAEYHGDLDPAMWAVVGLLAALRHKEHTGEGQLVDVAQLDVMIAMCGIPISNYFAEGKLAWEIWEDRPTAGILFGFFEAKDGYVYVAAEGGQVDRLKQITGKELESPDEMQEWVSDKTKNEVIEALIAVSIPVAPVYQLNEMVEDPQVKARNMIVQYEHPIAGMMRQPNFPIKFSKTPADVKPAPALGQHNEEILKSLGYTDEQIIAMRKAGAIL